MAKYCGLLTAGCLALVAVPGLASGPSFHPDVTMSGTSLNGWHSTGAAEWSAEKGEIVGRPGQAGSGWLVLDQSYQDVNFYTEFRCADGCVTGVLFRAEKTPDGGMKGI